MSCAYAVMRAFERDATLMLPAFDYAISITPPFRHITTATAAATKINITPYCRYRYLRLSFLRRSSATFEMLCFGAIQMPSPPLTPLRRLFSLREPLILRHIPSPRMIITIDILSYAIRRHARAMLSADAIADADALPLRHIVITSYCHV